MDARAVGQRIKAAREKKNMTQEDLAACIDISPTHVSVIERGTKIPRMDTFVAIANVLGVSADDLLVDVVDRATAGVLRSFLPPSRRSLTKKDAGLKSSVCIGR